jgi:dihydrofolate reductase
MRIIAIVAMGNDRIIGDPNGGIPWVNIGKRISEDFKHFKQMTMGSPMVVGRKTFEEFPKPLPGRLHCVVSGSEHDSDDENVIYFKNPNQAIITATERSRTGKVFIIGGATIYDHFLNVIPSCDEILLTQIDINLPDGPKFPDFKSRFHLVDSRRQQEAHELDYEFQTWVRDRDEHPSNWTRLSIH